MIHIDPDELRKTLAQLADAPYSTSEAMQNYDQTLRKRDYMLYGVDNDFDLAEARFERFLETDPLLVSNPAFVEFRLDVARRPEFREKCLLSPAFADVRDMILEQACDVES